MSDIADKIPSITGLTTSTTLNAIKNTIPTADDTYNKIKSNKLYITLVDSNKFTKDIFDAKQKNKKKINK